MANIIPGQVLLASGGSEHPMYDGTHGQNVHAPRPDPGETDSEYGRSNGGAEKI